MQLVSCSIKLSHEANATTKSHSSWAEGKIAQVNKRRKILEDRIEIERGQIDEEIKAQFEMH